MTEIFIFDLFLTAALYLAPALILRFVILKKGVKAIHSIWIAFILGFVSKLIYNGVCQLFFGITITGTSLPIFWVVINMYILADHSKKEKKDKRML